VVVEETGAGVVVGAVVVEGDRGAGVVASVSSPPPHAATARNAMASETRRRMESGIGARI
jgi:hypothetical protein